MSTSDGISTTDWDQVQKITQKITYANSLGESSKLLVKMLQKLLDPLAEKYGRLPSILSLKAEHTDDAELKLSLLKEAYVSALELRDDKHIAYITGSLVEYYIHKANNSRNAKFWLPIFEKSLKNYSDAHLSALLIELMGKVNKR